MGTNMKSTLRPPAPRLTVENLGPIRKAEVTFGDLTILVGPQASGKSIFLQTLKLLLDAPHIRSTMLRYGLNPRADTGLEIYFGEGMSAIWQDGKSKVCWDESTADLATMLAPRKGRKPANPEAEKAFLIPAQRILAIDRAGWVRGFSDYAAGDPYAVRDFSEKVRSLLETGLHQDEAIFPQSGRLKSEIREVIRGAIFGRYQLELEKSGLQKRFVLRDTPNTSGLPFMVWSAGQREFMPLLLGLYWLLPSSRTSMRDSVRWVMIEELEMGLHPKAIEALLATVLDLLERGYRICLSTHSPTVLDFVWAMQALRQTNAPADALRKILSLPSKAPINEMVKSAMLRDVRVYSFSKDTGHTTDISALDPGSENPDQATWGGLAEFGSRAANVVAKAVAEAES